MWYEHLYDRHHIKNIYTKVPNLIRVKIGNFNLVREGDSVIVKCYLFQLPDKPPHKWQGIELYFCGIDHVSMTYSSNSSLGDITIEKILDGYLDVKITSKMKLCMRVEDFFIQELRPVDLAII